MKTCVSGLHSYTGVQCRECKKLGDARYGPAYKKRMLSAGLCGAGCGSKLHWSNKNYCLKHVCDRHRVRYTLGVGFDRRMVMYENQGGACLICGVYESDPAALHVDHDHRTKAVRGLLCVTCNLGVGHLKDSPRLLSRAARYLGKEAPLGPRL